MENNCGIIKPSTCTSCGKEMDAAICVNDNAAKPKANDITLCLYCGHIMAFSEDLSLRDLSNDEIISIAGNKLLMEVEHIRHEVMSSRNGKAP